MILKSEYGNLVVNTDNEREIEHLKDLGFKQAATTELNLKKQGKKKGKKN